LLTTTVLLCSTGAELDGKTISIHYAQAGAGTGLNIARRQAGFRDRDTGRIDARPRGRRDLDFERRGDRRNGRYRAAYNKRRFNDRVREQRSYRPRR